MAAHKHTFSFKTKNGPFDLPKPVACVVRLGAFGDVAQAAAVCGALKKRGYSVVLCCSYPASEAVAFDPNIDSLIVQLQDQVPGQELGYLWLWQRGQCDKFINLTEAVESNLLAMEGSIRFEWPASARHALMNVNYLEHQFRIAGVPYAPPTDYRFYPTQEEHKWAREEILRMRKAGIEKFILWGVAGSSRTHKLWPHQDSVFNHLLKYYPKWGIVTAGDGSCKPLEAGYEGQKRIWKTCGVWTARQVFTMIQYADVIVGPETGLMSIAAFYPNPKVVFLSHSTVENLTRDWVNTTSLWAPNTFCPGRGNNEAPACHMLLPKFEPGCRRHEVYGTAQCVAEIKPEWVWEVLQKAMNEGYGGSWSPPAETVLQLGV